VKYFLNYKIFQILNFKVQMSLFASIFSAVAVFSDLEIFNNLKCNNVLGTR
jgi:hypothetical protein